MKKVSIDRINKIIFFSVLTCVVLYFGRDYLVMLIFSGFLAMLVTPVSNFLEKYKIPRGISALISILILMGVIMAFGMLISAQVNNISQDMPQIKTKFEGLMNNVQAWINDNFGISSEKQIEAVKKNAAGTFSGAGNFLGGIIKGTFTFTGTLLLIFVFTFLFLLKRDKYENFVVMINKNSMENETKEMVSKISKIAQKYLTGRIISTILLTILYVIGFEIIGLKHAVLLSLVAGVIAFVPYIGTFLGGLAPVFMAFVEGSDKLILGVVVVILISHGIQNFLIEPYVVGGSVNIDPLFTILSLIIGDVLWGVAGIILFLPLVGILKIIFENVKKLNPYAYLIGDQRESNMYEKIRGKLNGIFSSKKNS
jgi:predicted PurR-regulated permease PerM